MNNGSRYKSVRKPLGNKDKASQWNSTPPKTPFKKQDEEFTPTSTQRPKPQPKRLSEHSKSRLTKTTPKIKRRKMSQKDMVKIGHNLSPLVTISENGISEELITETNQRLQDHELIKIKLAIGDRVERKTMADEIINATKAQLVQSIGKIILIYKATDRFKPKLSNLERFKNA